MFDTFEAGLRAGAGLDFGPAMIAALAAGVVTSLTPCVYPVLPITIGVLGRAGRDASEAYSRLRHIGNAGLYALGLAGTYAGLGYAAASAGVFFGAVATNPVTLILVANLLFLFAAWSMGWVSLPGFSLQSVAGTGVPMKKYQLVLMGAVSGLVIGPCTAPVFGALMFYIFSSGDRIKGALLLFTFALGMSLVLAAAGFIAGVAGRLPRSPRLMKAVSRFLALLVAITAEYLLVQAGRGLL
ncbi:cytochrome c biogenesis protein CcdA [Kordiimonas marina]|uniref:cytochrome c biogenesis protein CcdA n=1 Tax=Kordiimonas marina TaxID=2872312 RepID=UPI001FF575C5|nr:cytochrome c biogenesis protein CcdA [Kordiimonas marina]MCJ9428641.1 sulfite exporter TauE/SafE family protein [Kordiimonas marina]